MRWQLQLKDSSILITQVIYEYVAMSIWVELLYVVTYVVAELACSVSNVLP